MQLSAALDDLTVAMVPIRARLNHAPSLGRRDFEPEFREASHALQRERRRVREMLNRKHGARPSVSRPAPHRLLRSLRGTIQQAVGVAREADTKVNEARNARDALRRVRPPMVALEWQKNVRRPARDGLEDLDGLLRRVANAQTRCEMDPRRPWLPGLESRLDDLVRQADALRLDVALIRQRAKRAAASKPPPERRPGQHPQRRKHRPWTAETAREALDTWAAEHGRRPRARDLTDPEMPSYGTVHALLGGLSS